ncbi:MAG: DMT family transporter, partial [Gammaproteobacteria bacterium]|nr:DMT family transporter [Gammaproteobacteria bacterium]
MQRKQHIDMLGACILVGFSVLLGLNQALVKLVNEGFAPIFQGGLRSACAFLPVLLFALVMKRRLTLRDGSFAYGILNGVFFCLEFAFLFLALDYTTVARASLFFYIMPVWVAIGAHFLVPGEHLNRYKVIGLTLALVGVAYAFIENSSNASGSILGDFFALIAGVCWAAIALTTRTKLSACSAEMNLLYQLAVSAIVLTLISPLFGEPIREPTTTIALIFSFQVLAVVSVGFVVWFWLLS